MAERRDFAYFEEAKLPASVNGPIFVNYETTKASAICSQLLFHKLFCIRALDAFLRW